MSVDDLSQALTHHWVHDTSVYSDERQRVQLAFLLLVGAYTGQRPCSILDTRSQKDRHDIKVNAENNRKRFIDPLAAKYKDRRPIDTNEDSSGSEYEPDDAEAAKATVLQRGVLYKHIQLIVLRNEALGQRNPIVMKITFVHTKNEDRKQQP